MRPISMPVRDEYLVEVVDFFDSKDLPPLMSIIPAKSGVIFGFIKGVVNEGTI